MDFVNAALGHAGAVVGVGGEGLFQFSLLRRENFLDLGDGETYGIVYYFCHLLRWRGVNGLISIMKTSKTLVSKGLTFWK